MQRIILIGQALVLIGYSACGPSNAEIEDVMKRMFIEMTEGRARPSQLKAKARNIGKGRSAVCLTIERYDGEKAKKGKQSGRIKAHLRWVQHSSIVSNIDIPLSDVEREPLSSE